MNNIGYAFFYDRAVLVLFVTDLFYPFLGKEETMMSNEPKLAAPISSPRDYCASNRHPPFRGQTFEPGTPAWRKVGSGLIAVTDGTPRQHVGPGLVFAVDWDADGKPQIASYGCTVAQGSLGDMKPYTYETLRTWVAKGKIVRRQWITYEEMVVMVRRLLPMTWVPTPEEFWAEYGLSVRPKGCGVYG